jgi:hypothetical protein
MSSIQRLLALIRAPKRQGAPLICDTGPSGEIHRLYTP